MTTADLPVWDAPRATGPISWNVRVPGSKSITNRALILSAIADYPSTIHGALRSRDSDLMMAALSQLGVTVRDEEPSHGSASSTIRVEPKPLKGGTIECGLAGTVMRFVPAVAALASGTVYFDGDAQARKRPMNTLLDALRELGVKIDGDTLPFIVHAEGAVEGGIVELDASASSQFVSALLLAGAKFKKGLIVRHVGGRLPSMPHIEMTVDMLRQAGVRVDTSVEKQWTIAPGPIEGRNWRVEPDLSNATPFLAAAAVTGGTVRVLDWPLSTTQPGDAIRSILTTMGCEVEMISEGASYALEVRGPEGGKLKGIEIDLSDLGELTPTVAALAVLAETPSRLEGIAHLRGHETDRLAALTAEINALGGNCEELPDGLLITPAFLHGGKWHSYADHRMATAGAIIGLRVDGVQVENIETTSKTLPGFADMWENMLTDSVKENPRG